MDIWDQISHIRDFRRTCGIFEINIMNIGGQPIDNLIPTYFICETNILRIWNQHFAYFRPTYLIGFLFETKIYWILEIIILNIWDQLIEYWRPTYWVFETNILNIRDQHIEYWRPTYAVSMLSEYSHLWPGPGRRNLFVGHSARQWAKSKEKPSHVLPSTAVAEHVVKHSAVHTTIALSRTVTPAATAPAASTKPLTSRDFPREQPR